MRTSNMIYQAAVAHQAELRRTAAGGSLKADRSESRGSAARLIGVIVSRRARASAAPQPATIGTPSVSI